MERCKVDVSYRSSISSGDAEMVREGRLGRSEEGDGDGDGDERSRR